MLYDLLQVDLFSHLTTKDNDNSDAQDVSASDTTDSEESEYSGLEDEEDSSEPGSFEVDFSIGYTLGDWLHYVYRIT